MSDGGRPWGLRFFVGLGLLAFAAYTWWNSPERTALEVKLTANAASPSAEVTPEGMLPLAASQFHPPRPRLRFLIPTSSLGSYCGSIATLIRRRNRPCSTWKLSPRITS